MYMASSLWWKQVTGPVRLTEAISRGIANNSSVLFIIPADLPWRREMRYSIEELLKSENLDFNHIDCQDEFFGRDVGRFLLERFGSDTDKTGFRPHKDKLEHFLRTRGILSGKVIWLKGILPQQLDEWIAFLCSYKANKREDGLFVVESTGIPATVRIPGTMTQIRYDDYVSQYDSHLFASILASQAVERKCLQHYATAVASSLCGLDAEVISDIIENMDFASEDPLEKVHEIFHMRYEMTCRGVCCEKYPHPFYLIRNGKEEEMENRLWGAQVQIAFPLVEKMRMWFINKYHAQIVECLIPPVKQFDHIITNPRDAELGTLVYLMSKRREEENQRRLYIPSPSDYEYIHFLHEVRNKLAHMDLCTTYEIVKLLSSTLDD